MLRNFRDRVMFPQNRAGVFAPTVSINLCNNEITLDSGNIIQSEFNFFK